jgi:hypothetical protein
MVCASGRDQVEQLAAEAFHRDPAVLVPDGPGVGRGRGDCVPDRFDRPAFLALVSGLDGGDRKGGEAIGQEFIEAVIDALGLNQADGVFDGTGGGGGSSSYLPIVNRRPSPVSYQYRV